MALTDIQKYAAATAAAVGAYAATAVAVHVRREGTWGLHRGVSALKGYNASPSMLTSQVMGRWPPPSMPVAGGSIGCRSEFILEVVRRAAEAFFC